MKKLLNQQKGNKAEENESEDEEELKKIDQNCLKGKLKYLEVILIIEKINKSYFY